MRHPDRVAAVLLLLLAAFTIIQALALPYWHEFAPGPGFFPLWLGVLLAAASGVLLVRPAPARQALPPDAAGRRRLLVMLALASAAAAAAPIVGMVAASGAFLAAALFYLNPERPRANIAVAIGGPLVVWLIFVRWLTVPLPRGPWGF